MTKYIRNSKTISGRLLDEMVMMDPDQGKYFSLNQSATAIWELLEKPLTADEICDVLSKEYQVDQGLCSKEVDEYLEQMMKLKLVVIAT